MNNLSQTYNEIMKEYDSLRTKNQAALMNRYKEVINAVPEYKIIEDKISDISVRAAIDKLHDHNTDDYKSLIEDLSSQKTQLLIDNNFPADYLNTFYECPLCKDTGYIDGVKCRCLLSRLIEARYINSHLKEVLDKENFSTLVYDFYSEEEAERIKKVVNASKSFIENFDNEFNNLLFLGEVGTGKTFISNCIAKELLDLGKTVIYFTAPGLFESISASFKKDSDIDSNAFYEDIFNCDLLILDDLGTESYNSFTVGQFFIILNERLSRRKSTIISTNMDIQRLKDAYSERSISRILGGYDMFYFKGQDLRLSKKIKNNS